MITRLIVFILWSNTKWPADVTGPRTIVWEPEDITSDGLDEPGTMIEKTAHMDETRSQSYSHRVGDQVSHRR